MGTTRSDLATNFDVERLTPAFFACPYPTYRALREYDPVKRLSNGSYFLTRYDDVVAAYNSTKQFSSDQTRAFAPKYGNSLLFELQTTSLMFNDPPAHTRMRRIIGDALSPSAIAEMEPHLLTLVDQLLDRLAERGRIDLIADFAAAIPIEVIGHLLNVPHDERAPLRDWSLAVLAALEPVVSGDSLARGNAAIRNLIAYLEVLVERRRARPGNPERDVLTRLIHGEDGGERLTSKELLHNCIFLLNVGREATTNLMGNALVTLAAHPGEKQRLIDNPELIRTAVEELLRFESSNQFCSRITTEAVEIGGVTMAANTPVTLCVGAANRDPAQFADPDRLDLGRAPNPHLAFGAGVHQCVGMALARLQGAIAISLFLSRFPNYLLDGPPVRGARARLRGFLNVPCSVGFCRNPMQYQSMETALPLT